MSVQLLTLLTLCLTFTQSVCMYSNNHWGEWNDSQLQPTIQKLMKGYNRYLRPNFNEGPVEIGMSLDIASIDAISEINMDYTATIFLRQRWRDSRLVFPGNESVSVDGRLVSLLWIPDTFIPDSKRSFLHDVTVENRLIRIFSNGTVLYALRYRLTCMDGAFTDHFILVHVILVLRILNRRRRKLKGGSNGKKKG